MKKLILLLGLAALAYWFARDHFGGEPDEFVFTEAPADDFAAPASEPPAAG